ncbi:uncharacterized protein MONOS_12319 [Monocercomonoides exilis]|uniref:uncharacterized protein n=1 Tax=Monocercomonoides exilis TaxID=2049356 RepID=UPI003559BE83|nr:hypothetical protein MONOS_12319 [Monocercomonoides exilis]|eukprot:MONOS_12319.1-p1 / transcript=MONOS_12319.1 / gene=MONOS_12319 / organism=Monocercomonoides_exilis_PA203 / gene_product=unspecified product / transcript_product=unspecified product / location=Mono_scaffold00675:12502-13572(+) / protein_length=357 / sequence_SO=supercontig / SO=protein_coding / is_pseudo=false
MTAVELNKLESEYIAGAPSIAKVFLFRCEDTQLRLCFFRALLCVLSAVLKSVSVYLSKTDASLKQQHLSILLQQLFFFFTSLLDLLPAKQKKTIQFVPLFPFLCAACFLSPVCSWLLLLSNYPQRCQDFLSPSLSIQSGKWTNAVRSLYSLATLDSNSACQDELHPFPRESAMVLLISLISHLYDAPSPSAPASLSILMILKGTKPTSLFASDSSFSSISLPSIPISQEDAFYSIISQSFCNVLLYSTKAPSHVASLCTLALSCFYSIRPDVAEHKLCLSLLEKHLTQIGVSWLLLKPEELLCTQIREKNEKKMEAYLSVVTCTVTQAYSSSSPSSPPPFPLSPLSSSFITPSSPL